MADRDRLDILASDREREDTVARLHEACSDGRLTFEECSHRVQYALTARTRDQLDRLILDLPAISAAPRKEITSSVAIFGSVDRTGRWRLGEEHQVRVLCGSCEIDLREATISAHDTTIEVDITMGSLEVIVPRGAEVDVDVRNILGSRSVRLNSPPATANASLIRIVGTVRAGSLTVRDQQTLSERIQDRVQGMLGS